MESGGERAAAVDGLRGIAAAAVMLSHVTVVGFYRNGPLWDALNATPLRILWAGHQSVILFFVISGFALAAQIERMGGVRGGTLVPFWSSRMLRLYPPYVASIVLAIAGYSALAAVGFGYAPEKFHVPAANFEIGALLSHLWMVGSFDTTRFNPPIWSIVHEMRISLLFPAIYLVLLRFGPYRPLLVAILVSLSVAALGERYAPSAGLTLHYATFFALGATLWQLRRGVAATLTAFPARGIELIVAIGLLIFAYPFDNPWTYGQRVLGDLAVAIGAAVLLGVVVVFGGGRILDNAPVRFLGRISYSLYLNHVLALNVAILLFYGRVPAPVLWVVAIVWALGLSWLMYHLFEKPWQAAARTLRRRLLGHADAAPAKEAGAVA